MRIWVVDAFTDVAFAGNPAGVVLLDDYAGPDVDDAWMQALAGELGWSETAFLRRQDDGYRLRWFTPSVEVDLCGHATLASAHVLAAAGATGPIRFGTRSGVLTATPRDGAISLDFPGCAPVASDEATAAGAALGVEVRGAHRAGADLLVEVADEAAVRGVRIDVPAVLALPGVRGVIVTAASAQQGIDFVSRFFAPAVGIEEDPVTGSAHCALAPFWAGRLGRTELVGDQLSPRGGRVGVRVAGDRVHLIGTAVTVLEGRIEPGALPSGRWTAGTR